MSHLLKKTSTLEIVSVYLCRRKILCVMNDSQCLKQTQTCTNQLFSDIFAFYPVFCYVSLSCYNQLISLFLLLLFIVYEYRNVFLRLKYFLRFFLRNYENV